MATLLAGATIGLAADVKPAPKPVPWHVSNAEIRVPVKVDVTAALLRMPPQVYIADLKPLKITGGLAFNPKTKSAIQRDIRKPQEKAAAIAKEKERYKKAKTTWDPKAYSRLGEEEGGPILRVSGSVTVAIKPEYKYFSWGPSGAAKVTIDGKRKRERATSAAKPPTRRASLFEARGHGTWWWLRGKDVSPDSQSRREEDRRYRYVLMDAHVTGRRHVASASQK